jgi:hypothetical protein
LAATGEPFLCGRVFDGRSMPAVTSASLSEEVNTHPPCPSISSADDGNVVPSLGENTPTHQVQNSKILSLLLKSDSCIDYVHTFSQ